MYPKWPFKAKPWAPGGYTYFRPDHMTSEKWDRNPKDATMRRVQRKQQRRLNDHLCGQDEEGGPDED
jgi:hypothetical protein